MNAPVSAPFPMPWTACLLTHTTQQANPERSKTTGRVQGTAHKHQHAKAEHVVEANAYCLDFVMPFYPLERSKSLVSQGLSTMKVLGIQLGVWYI